MRLLNLYRATNAALNAVHRRRRRVKGAINWASLSCVEACQVEAYDGGDTTIRLQVTIEEVAPGQSEFIHEVTRELEKRGWKDVEVLTEW